MKSFKEYMEAKERIKKRCNECDFLFQRDEGYSDYTVEHTEYACLKNAPFAKSGLDFDKIDEENSCSKFKKGPGVHINVEFRKGDAERIFNRTEERYLLAKKKGLLPDPKNYEE